MKYTNRHRPLHRLAAAVFLLAGASSPVLAAHPGRIAEVIEVPLPQPRSAEIFTDPRFVVTRKRLDDLIHPKDVSAERLPITRMTVVGDDVL